MNGAYAHIAINHIPVLGVPFAVLILAWGLFKKSNEVSQAGFLLLILVAVMSVLSDQTGDKAAELVRSIPGIERARIHEHAQAADFALWGGIILGVLSLFGLWKSRDGMPKTVAIVTLVGAIFVTTIMMRVAHLGGLIRHPEIASSFVPPQAAP